MSTSGNVCGNCTNFRPKQGEKFFNCTFAKQAGVQYRMQVRPDTRACEAFSSAKQPSKPQQIAKPVSPPPKRSEPQRGGLCNWGRLLLLVALIIAILLLAWGAYTCFFQEEPTPTPTPGPTPTATPAPTPTGGGRTPTPTPTPIPVFQYNFGEWVISPPWMYLASSAETATILYLPGPLSPPAGSYYQIVTVSVTNGGTSTLPMSASYFTIVDDFGLSFPSRLLPITFFNAFPYEVVWVDPGETVGGRMLFIIPNISTGLNLRTSVASGYLQWYVP